MSTKSKIEWTDTTWNPVTGCTKISQGCKNCYAERMAYRLQAMGNKRYLNGFNVTLHKDLIDQPLKWKKSRVIFVNSMSDLFHEEVPLEFIQRIFDTMNNSPHHIFQVLTKRSTRLVQFAQELTWTQNIWMGVSVENADVVQRIYDLKQVPAAVRFLSLEPLLGPLPKLPLQGIDWVIVGGESGPGARPLKKEWVEDILQQTKMHNIPFFFKQWGGVRKARAGRLLNGKTYNNFPFVARKHPALAFL